MKYFAISLEEAYTDVPQIINWYEKINPKWINQDDAYRLPSRELLFVKSQNRVIYTDILVKPFFLVSAMTRSVILMYDSLINMKEIILLDTERQESKLYFLPIFEEIECLEETFLSNGKIGNLVLDYDKVKNKSIFTTKGQQGKYVIGNLELIESLLKRGATGIGLREIGCRSKGNKIQSE